MPVPKRLAKGQFQIVHCVGQQSTLRFAHQQVYVFGHGHVSIDGQGEAAAHLRHDLDEERMDRGGVDPTAPRVTSKVTK